MSSVAKQKKSATTTDRRRARAIDATLAEITRLGERLNRLGREDVETLEITGLPWLLWRAVEHAKLNGPAAARDLLDAAERLGHAHARILGKRRYGNVIDFAAAKTRMLGSET